MKAAGIHSVSETKQLAKQNELAFALPTFSLTEVMSKVVQINTDWSSGRLEAAELGYRNFLGQAKLKAGRLAPTTDVDEVWHTHIIFTQQYHTDCESYFGYYLHHVPSTAEARGGESLCTPPCVCVQPEDKDVCPTYTEHQALLHNNLRGLWYTTTPFFISEL